VGWGAGLVSKGPPREGPDIGSIRFSFFNANMFEEKNEKHFVDVVVVVNIVRVVHIVQIVRIRSDRKKCLEVKKKRKM